MIRGFGGPPDEHRTPASPHRTGSRTRRGGIRSFLPQGRVLRLWPYRMGTFGATWRPSTPLTSKVTLKVVAVDKAHNKSVFDLVFDPATGKLTRTGASR